MKFKVGDSGDEIEIGQYREVHKGSLRAFFSLVIYSAGTYMKGDKTLDCRYCISGEKRWFNFPHKEVKDRNGSNSEYIPYRSFADKEYKTHLSTAVLSALKEAEKSYVRDHSLPGPKSVVSPKSPPIDWEDMPF